MEVCFLSAGLPADDPAQAVTQHVRALAAAGDAVTLALTDRRPASESAGAFAGAHVVAVERALEQRFDVAIACDWQSTARLFEVPAARRAYLVDHFAHHRMGDWQLERLAAALSYDLPVDFVATAQWVRSALADQRPGARVLLARSGVDKDVFAATEPDRADGALRVLVDDRHAPDPRCSPARAVIERMAEPHEADALLAGENAPARAAKYARADVVVMLSAVDGVLGAPLEAMHAGATCVVLPATDCDDLVVHDENGLVADPDDERGAARLLDLLARDRGLLARLREGARETAQRWPDWEQSAADMRAALEQILREEAPDDARWPTTLMADAMSAVALYRTAVFKLQSARERAENEPTYRAALRLRDAWRSPRLRKVRNAASPVTKAAMKRLQ